MKSFVGALKSFISPAGRSRASDSPVGAADPARLPSPPVAPSAGPTVQAAPVLSEVRRFIEGGQLQRALDLLDQIKLARVAIPTADYLRALAFFRAQRELEAVEALKEELRWFPDNVEARALLDKLAAHQPAPQLPEDPEFRGLFAVVRPYTMLGAARLHSLFTHARELCRRDLPGNFVECGVAAGGSCALLAAVVARHSQRPRRVFACDSFQGMPPPGTLDRHGGQPAGPLGWGGGTCSAPVDSLLEVCRKLRVEALVEAVPGFFEKSLPAARERFGPVAFLHMDGDWYDSTRQILDNLYAQVVQAGRIQIDDYGFWEGCRRAVDDFQRESRLVFTLHPIDETGVWMEKSEPMTASAAQAGKLAGGRLLNLGCGAHFHPDWTNVDIAPADPRVLAHDLQQRLPFEDGVFQAVYHSHVLEHLPHAQALPFLRECHRVLARTGVLRVVVPDLETIARLYLKSLEGGLAGDAQAAQRYHWIVLELLDQLTRESSGGEMRAYWQQNPMPAEGFVLERMGQEVRGLLASLRGQPAGPQPVQAPSSPEVLALGRFRLSGEVHRWMYDRFSLAGLLRQAGFTEVQVRTACESRIPDFARYQLDVTPEGSVRKPDSLFMEAVKPAAP